MCSTMMIAALAATISFIPYVSPDPNPSLTSSECVLSLNELQLGEHHSNEEFIELKKTCPEVDTQDVDITNYYIAFWLGGKHGKSAGSLAHLGNFSSGTLISTTFFVIGSPEMRPHETSNTTTFISFEDFGSNWIKGQDFWIDKGEKRVNALVLYANISAGTSNLNMELSDETAHRSNIVDVLFFTRGGTGRKLKDFLLPEYKVGQPGSEEDSYYRLTDENDADVPFTDIRSFSFCCGNVTTKWPMGFKWSKPSPGTKNNCGREYEYCLDPKGSTFPLYVDRCDVDAITNFFVKTTTKARTTQSSTTTPVSTPPATMNVTTGPRIGEKESQLDCAVIYGLQTTLAVKVWFRPCSD